jgi:putative transposase
VREWLPGSETLYIEPGSPWENGDNESFKRQATRRAARAKSSIPLMEARVLIERWPRHYNQLRPHSSLGYRPPAPVTITPGRADPAFAIPGLWPDRPALRSRTGLT